MPASLRPCPTPLAPQWIRCLSLLVGLGWASWATIPFIGSAVPDGWVTTAGRGGASPLGQVLDGWVTWDRCCCPLAAFPLRLPPCSVPLLLLSQAQDTGHLPGGAALCIHWLAGTGQVMTDATYSHLDHSSALVES